MARRILIGTQVRTTPAAVSGPACVPRDLKSVGSGVGEGSGNADPGTVGLFLYGFNVEYLKIGGNKDPAFAWPMHLGQASLRELIGAVAAQVEPADGDGRAPLGAAEKQLQRSCEDLAQFPQMESQYKTRFWITMCKPATLAQLFADIRRWAVAEHGRRQTGSGWRTAFVQGVDLVG